MLFSIFFFLLDWHLAMGSTYIHMGNVGKGKEQLAVSVCERERLIEREIDRERDVEKEREKE